MRCFQGSCQKSHNGKLCNYLPMGCKPDAILPTRLITLTPLFVKIIQFYKGDGITPSLLTCMHTSFPSHEAQKRCLILQPLGSLRRSENRLCFSFWSIGPRQCRGTVPAEGKGS